MTFRDVLKHGMDERTTNWKDAPEDEAGRSRRYGFYSVPAPKVDKTKTPSTPTQKYLASRSSGSTSMLFQRKSGKSPKRLTELERTTLAAVMKNATTVIRPHATEKRLFKRANPGIRFVSNRTVAMFSHLAKKGESFSDFEERLPNRVQITPMGRDFRASLVREDGTKTDFHSKGIASVIIDKSGQVRIVPTKDRVKQGETWVPTYVYAAWKVDGERRGIHLADYLALKTFKLRQDRTREGDRRLTRIHVDGSHDVMTFEKHVAFYLSKGEIRYLKEQPYPDTQVAEACDRLSERGLVVKKDRKSPITLTNLKLTSAGEVAYLENPRKRYFPKRHTADSTIPEARSLSPLDWQLLWRAVGEDHTPLLSPENHIGQPASKKNSPATKKEIETALNNLKSRDLIATPQLRGLELTAKGRLLLKRPNDQDRAIIDKREKQLRTVVTAVGFVPEMTPLDPHSKEALDQLKGNASLKRIREYTHSGMPVHLWIPKSKAQNAPVYKRRELGHDLILAEGLRQIMLKLEAEGARVVGYRSERELRSEQTRILQGSISPQSPDHFVVGLPDGVITYRTAFEEEKALAIEADAGHSPLSNSRGYSKEAIAAKMEWAKSRSMELVFVVDHPARAANLRRDGREVFMLQR